jgi:hypothetical protein
MKTQGKVAVKKIQEWFLMDLIVDANILFAALI